MHRRAYNPAMQIVSTFFIQESLRLTPLDGFWACRYALLCSMPAALVSCPISVCAFVIVPHAVESRMREVYMAINRPVRQHITQSNHILPNTTFSRSV